MMLKGMSTALVGMGLAFGVVAACSEGISTPKVAEKAQTPLAITAHGMAHNQLGGVDDTVSSAHISEAALAEIRQLTLPYRDFAASQTANYTHKVTDCFTSPTLGGMGFHYANDEFLLDGKAEAFKPDVLLYVPDRNGTLQLVGVEYAVPIALWTDPNPPELFGVQFHQIPEFGVWALHAWIWNQNSSGIFTDFNPGVSCQFAQ